MVDFQHEPLVLCVDLVGLLFGIGAVIFDVVQFWIGTSVMKPNGGRRVKLTSMWPEFEAQLVGLVLDNRHGEGHVLSVKLSRWFEGAVKQFELRALRENNLAALVGVPFFVVARSKRPLFSSRA